MFPLTSDVTATFAVGYAMMAIQLYGFDAVVNVIYVLDVVSRDEGLEYTQAAVRGSLVFRIRGCCCLSLLQLSLRDHQPLPHSGVNSPTYTRR